MAGFKKLNRRKGLTYQKLLHFQFVTPPAVESPKGTAPSGAHGTVREPLDSYGSSYPTADTQPIRQCAINNGALLATFPKQQEARLLRPLNFLYLPIAQRTSVAST